MELANIKTPWPNWGRHAITVKASHLSKNYSPKPLHVVKPLI
jgi:hypothetical protein